MQRKRRLYMVKPGWERDDESIAKRLAVLESVGVKAPENPQSPIFCDADTAIALMHAGFCGGWFSPDHIELVHEAEDELASMLDDILHRAMHRITNPVVATSGDGESADLQYNDKVRAMQPDDAVMGRVVRLRLLENACTDEVQGRLAEGWRIIAVCPQPDQRRPDYVLGHALPADVPTTAER